MKQQNLVLGPTAAGRSAISAGLGHSRPDGQAQRAKPPQPLQVPCTPTPEDPPHPETGSVGGFPTTHWDTVLALSHTDTAAAAEALETLCRAYWYPVYAYIRRRGCSSHEAEDLTQGFFASFLAKDHWTRTDRNKGRLRSYLLGAVNHYLSDAHDRDRRLMRGGGQPLISLDLHVGEERYLAERADPLTPERLFERRWALALLDRVLDNLEAEYRTRGQAVLFRRIQGFLTGKDSTDSYAEAAAEFGLSEVGLRSAVHRLRKRYGQLFREEIAGTVADPEDLETEIRHLAEVLGTG